ncbi:hypothetical protein [Streptomyces daliensis]
MSESPRSQRALEATLEGLPLALQGIGTITRNLKAYGAGVAVNGIVGLKQVADEAGHAWQIYWHPDHIHPKPNYYKAASGVVNVVGAAVYGASSAGALSPALGGAGAIAQGVSYYAAKLLPQDAGTYYPPLPTHHGPVGPDVARPPLAPGSTTVAQAAALSATSRGTPTREGGTAKPAADSHANRPHAGPHGPHGPHAGTVTRGGGAPQGRRHSL